MTMPSPVEKDPDLDTLINRYVSSSEFRSLKPSSQKTYLIYLGRLKPLYRRRVSTLSRGDIYGVSDDYSATPGAQAAIMKVSRRMFSWGIEREVIATAPLLKGTRYDLAARKPKPHPMWQDAEIIRFRKAAQEYAEANPDYHFVQDALEIALASGQRIGDICNAMLMSGWDGETYRMTQSKTGEVIRFKPVGKFLEILQDGVKTKRKYVLDIPPPLHGRLPRLRYHFDAVREMANVEPTFHGLRKTVAVKLEEKGASKAQIAALLGHSTTRMVDLYTAEAKRVSMASAAAELMSMVQFEGERHAD